KETFFRAPMPTRGNPAAAVRWHQVPLLPPKELLGARSLAIIASELPANHLSLPANLHCRWHSASETPEKKFSAPSPPPLSRLCSSVAIGPQRRALPSPRPVGLPVHPYCYLQARSRPAQTPPSIPPQMGAPEWRQQVRNPQSEIRQKSVPARRDIPQSEIG